MTYEAASRALLILASSGLHFAEPDAAWEQFVTDGRQGATHGHDVVSGPILANPGAIRSGEPLRSLSSNGAAPLQVSFHTGEGVDTLMRGLQ